MTDLVPITRAMISVSNKTGIEDLARTLRRFGCAIIATGGTKRALDRAGIESLDVALVTGNPEAFGGRMKTISFHLESALLFDREADRGEAEALGIQPIDLVVCNLYPFDAAKKSGADHDTLIQHIDIGGPTMIRAAAKNFRHVAVVTSPDDYAAIADELERTEGSLSGEMRSRLMRKAFNYTADYDALIATTMDELHGSSSIRMAFESGRSLRYGENAHQSALFYRKKNASLSLHDMTVLHGKEISFNNIVDIHAALSSVRDLRGSGCAIVKHTNPCGLAVGRDQRAVFEAAWNGDPLSAFGSVIAFNQTIERHTVEFLGFHSEKKRNRKFVEVVVGPGYEPAALDYLFGHKDVRVAAFDPGRVDGEKDFKVLWNALLVQDSDHRLFESVNVVTEVESELDMELVEFGLLAVRQIKSNAIAAVRQLPAGTYHLLGMGAGQPNRVTAVELTLRKCLENLRCEFQGDPDTFALWLEEEMGRVLVVSDAFFPFPDSIDLCAEYGVKSILQPGGSIRDKAVIERCNERQICMAFVGLRHFRH